MMRKKNHPPKMRNKNTNQTATGSQIGANTHHQDQVIQPANLAITKMSVKMQEKLIGKFCFVSVIGVRYLRCYRGF